MRFRAGNAAGNLRTGQIHGHITHDGRGFIPHPMAQRDDARANPAYRQPAVAAPMRTYRVQPQLRPVITKLIIFTDMIDRVQRYEQLLSEKAYRERNLP